MSQSSDSLDPAHQDLIALLAWYQAAGVDCALDEAPVAWLGAPGRVPGEDFAWPERDTMEPATSRSSDRGTGSARAHSDRPAGVSQGAWTPAHFPSRAAAASSSARHGSAATSRGENRGEDGARPPPVRFATGSPEAAETAARALAARATDMAALDAALRGFDGCALKATAKSTCVYRGATQARVMIIGEAPGRDEDLEGRPFVGRAGQLLDRMLAAIDLDESSVHITNVVYWRPPGNRTPTPQETQICRPFLERQVELVKPEVVLLLGGAAAKTVLDTAEGIMRLRGKWRNITFGSAQVRALATLHPAYLLRTPAAKRLAWRDFLALKSVLQKN